MNKTVLTVGSAVVAGSISKGLTGMLTVSNPVKIALSFGLAIGSGYLASQVKGSDTKAIVMQGAYIGVAMAQSFEGVKAIAGTPAISDRLSSETAYGRFMQKTLGLSGAEGHVNGYWDADNNYHEEGMNGFIDNTGALHGYAQLGCGDQLAGGYYDENGNFVSDGLSAAELDDFDELNGFDDEDGMYAHEDEDELNGIELEFV